MGAPRHIALIAGETSGDQLGGWLMEALCARAPELQFTGIGGATMQAQGLHSLFPMQELSLMGFVEIIPHIFRLQRRIRQVVAHITETRPDIVVTIDSPGFNFRVIKAVRLSGMHPLPRFMHYVAPTVWAYKPERAAKTAALVDELLALLPFEPPYFEKEGLRTHFVGHEIAWWWKEKGDGAAFRAAHRIAAEAPLLAVFPGSRRGELKRMLPVYAEAVARLHPRISGLEVVLQVPEALMAEVTHATHDWPVPRQIISNTENKKGLFAAATVGLAKSGTIGLECALAGLASVTTYRANALSAMIVRRMLKTPYVNLANILLERAVIPELLQENCTGPLLAEALAPLLCQELARAAQRHALAPVATLLGASAPQSPSSKAAEIILNAG